MVREICQYDSSRCQRIEELYPLNSAGFSSFVLLRRTGLPVYSLGPSRPHPGASEQRHLGLGSLCSYSSVVDVGIYHPQNPRNGMLGGQHERACCLTAAGKPAMSGSCRESSHHHQGSPDGSVWSCCWPGPLSRQRRNLSRSLKAVG